MLKLEKVIINRISSEFFSNKIQKVLNLMIKIYFELIILKLIFLQGSGQKNINFPHYIL